MISDKEIGREHKGGNMMKYFDYLGDLVGICLFLYFEEIRQEKKRGYKIPT